MVLTSLLFLSTLTEGTSLFVGCRSGGYARSSSRSRNRLQRSAVAIGDPREKRREVLSRAPSGRYCPVVSNVGRDCVSAIVHAAGCRIRGEIELRVHVREHRRAGIAYVHRAVLNDKSASSLSCHGAFSRESTIHSLRQSL